MVVAKGLESLREKDLELLQFVEEHFENKILIDTEYRGEKLHIKLSDNTALHDMVLYHEGHSMVLVIGTWTHCRPRNFEALKHKIERVLREKIVIWKVSRPNGYTYYGHYDIDEYETHTCIVDQPDTVVEEGDRVQKSTFKKLVEDRVVAS